MLGTLSQSIAIMGPEAGPGRAGAGRRHHPPQVLDLGSADFSQRATAIVEGEKAALAAMPQIRERVARLQAERTAAPPSGAAKRPPRPNTSLQENRSGLQKMAGMAGLGEPCIKP